MARQRYTAEQVANALTAAQGMKTVAARNLGCTYQTVQNYIERYATVRQALDEALERLGDKIESTLLSRAFGKYDDDGNEIMPPSTAELIFLAKTHPAMKRRGYSERHELTGADGGALEFKLAYPDED